MKSALRFAARFVVTELLRIAALAGLCIASASCAHAAPSLPVVLTVECDTSGVTHASHWKADVKVLLGALRVVVPSGYPIRSGLPLEFRWSVTLDDFGRVASCSPQDFASMPVWPRQGSTEKGFIATLPMSRDLLEEALDVAMSPGGAIALIQAPRTTTLFFRNGGKELTRHFDHPANGQRSFALNGAAVAFVLVQERARDTLRQLYKGIDYDCKLIVVDSTAAIIHESPWEPTSPLEPQLCPSSLFFTSAENRRLVRVLDLRSHQVHPLLNTEGAQWFAVSGDGAAMVTASADRVTYWTLENVSAATRRWDFALPTSESPLRPVISPTGRFVALETFTDATSPNPRTPFRVFAHDGTLIHYDDTSRYGTPDFPSDSFLVQGAPLYRGVETSRTGKVRVFALH